MSFIDCHNHSLPYIDDGAKDIEMSLEMLRIAQNNQISDVILTPHHLNGAFENHADKIRQCFNELTLTAKESNIEVKLHIGSEVHLTHETANQLISGEALTYCNQGKAALIELPKHSIPLGAEKTFEALLSHGITPIIAHPERNSSIRRDLNILKKFIDMGCKSQLTAMSCTGDFGPELQKVSHNIIMLGYAHLIASDAHRNNTRLPILSIAAKLIDSQFNADVKSILLHENPKNLIQAKPLIATPKLNSIKKKSKFYPF